MQNISDELIERFLSGRCTPEEAAIVTAYLESHPEEDLLLREFEETDAAQELPAGYQEEMLSVIYAATAVEAQPARVVRPFWYWAAAAVVILTVGGWLLLQQAGKPGRQVALLKKDTAAASATFAWASTFNDSKQEKTMVLPDSSKVRLAPGTHFFYRKDFGAHTGREVSVEGKVWFSVVKNEEMPFTVYSEGIHTTVLGTVFDVMDEKSSDEIKVKLYEGKVRVTLDRVLSSTEQRDYYLMPGQEFVFSKNTRSVAIHHIEEHREEQLVKAHGRVPERISNWYMFNNQTLGEVFNQLSAIYNVEIEYSAEDVRQLYFIGKLEKKDSLNEILHDIALLNHLTVVNLNGKYIIRKEKP